MQEKRANPALLSFVIPLYNEESVAPFLRNCLESLAKELTVQVEWIMVNDGSTDSTQSFLYQWACQDGRVKLIDFARNFGHQAALTAGLDHASGDVVVFMDGDLQDPPELVIPMLEKYREGFDVVFAQRTVRHGEGIFKKLTASVFYRLMRKFVQRNLPRDTGDFRLMSHEAASALNCMREGHRFIRGMVSWLGFNQTAILFERSTRQAGQTKFPLKKMIRFAWDAVLSFSSAPLRLSLYLGALLFVVGIVFCAHALFVRYVTHTAVPGWTSIVVLQCLIGGSILLCLGLVGEYVGRTYDELKHRPIYVARMVLNIAPRELPPRAVVASYRQLARHPYHQEPHHDSLSRKSA